MPLIIRHLMTPYKASAFTPPDANFSPYHSYIFIIKRLLGLSCHFCPISSISKWYPFVFSFKRVTLSDKSLKLTMLFLSLFLTMQLTPYLKCTCSACIIKNEVEIILNFCYANTPDLLFVAEIYVAGFSGGLWSDSL